MRNSGAKKNSTRSVGAWTLKVCFGFGAALAVFGLPVDNEILAHSRLSTICENGLRALGVLEPYHRAPASLPALPFSEVIERMNNPLEQGRARILVGSRRQALVLTTDAFYEISAPQHEIAYIRKIKNFQDKTQSILPLSAEWQFIEVDLSSAGRRTLAVFESSTEEGSFSVFFGEREDIYILGEMLGEVQSRYRVTEPRLSQKRLARLMPTLLVGSFGLGLTFWGYDAAQNQAVVRLLDQPLWTQQTERILPWVLATSDAKEKQELVAHLHSFPIWSPVMQQAFLNLLRDSSIEVRQTAAATLDSRELPPEFWDLVPELMSDYDPAFRNQIASFLGRQPDWPAKFWVHIPQLLQHRNIDVRRATLIALQGQASLPHEIWNHVPDLLEDADWTLRFATVSFLHYHQNWPAEVWGLIPELLNDPHDDVQTRLGSVLGRQRWPTDFWALVPGLLLHQDSDVQDTIVAALVRQESWTLEVWEAVAEILNQPPRGRRVYDLEVYFESHVIPDTLPPALKEKLQGLISNP